MVDGFGMRNPLQYGLTKRPSATQFLQAADQPATGGALDPLRLMQLRQSVIEQQMRPQRTAAQQMMAMPTRMKPAPAVKPPSLSDRVSGMMPAAGTPQAAGLGAAGAKMLQLSGYSDKPISMSQILGEAAQAYTTAKKETAAEQAATLAAKQELKRQREKDALEAENIRSQIAERGKPPVSGLPTMGATRELTLPKGKTQLQEWNGSEYVNIGEPYTKTKTTKPSGFVTFVKDDDVQAVREDSEDADKLASQGYRIIEGSTLTGSMEDLMGKPTRTKIEGSLLGAQESYVELKNVRESFDPYFLTVKGKADFRIAKAKDAVGASTDDDKKLIQRYSQWQTNSWTQVNNYIKALTGAQMSEAEAKRIMKSLPDPRTGFFEGMTPTEYEQALNSTIDAAARTIARSSYFLEKGLKPVKDENRKYKRDDEGKIISGDGKNLLYVFDDQIIDTDDMDEIIRKETLSLRKRYASLPIDEAKTKVASELSRMFGLGFDDLRNIVSGGA